MVNYMFNSDDGVNNSPAYESMLSFAREQLLRRAPEETASCAGVEYDQLEQAFKFKSLGQQMIITLPTCAAQFAEAKTAPLWAWHLIMLHYLSEADGTLPGTELMTFRTQKDGFIRGAGFDRESANIIAKEFSDKPISNVKKACEAFNVEFKQSNADICAVFPFLPHYPVTIQIWAGDEEIAGSGQMLICSNAACYLSVEDAITVGSLILKFLKTEYDMLFCK